MNTDKPQTEEQAVVSYVEEQMELLAKSLREACAMRDRFSAAELRAILAEVNKAQANQAAYEHLAGSDWLSPTYLALAGEIDELREQLARALGRTTP